ncbi:MAG: Rv1155 class probable F420-dependent [Patescibacteria group bacterium]|nr:Rv1155 class probable F420-dependent [Patescibacteria group bacterium]
MVQKKSVASIEHKDRIKEELHRAGVTTLGRYRFSGMYLPEVIHEDEHIEAAIFGRHKELQGFFGAVEGMLVATDKRVIFIDHRPGYTTMDEFTYDVISGVNITKAVYNASVTLYTKVSNYRLSYVGKESAKKFANYIEERLEKRVAQVTESEQRAPPVRETILSAEAVELLNKRDIGVLSTIERTGSLRGAAVYYVVKDGYVYFMTKENTRKARNIVGNEHVAFTVFDDRRLETVQLAGMAERVTDNKTRMKVITSILRTRTYSDGSHLVPVIRMGAETNTLVYRIVVTDFDYTNFINLDAQKSRPPQ